MDDHAAWPGPEVLGDAPRPVLSVVVPAFNAAHLLMHVLPRRGAAMAGLGLSWEVVFVATARPMRRPGVRADVTAARSEVAVVALSRNSGKEAAPTAGLAHARATGAAIVIDADLQDPPEVTPDLVAAWRRGADIADAQRGSPAGGAWAKRATAHVFERLMQRIGGPVRLPADTGAFRLMSWRSVDALLRLRERHCFMKGLFAWVRFRAEPVPHDRARARPARPGGTYPRLFALSLDGITSFTTWPPRAATWLALASAGRALAFGVRVAPKTALRGDPVAGYPSLKAVILLLGGVRLITLGIVGEDLGRVFNATRAGRSTSCSSAGRSRRVEQRRPSPGGRRRPCAAGMRVIPTARWVTAPGGGRSVPKRCRRTLQAMCRLILLVVAALAVPMTGTAATQRRPLATTGWAAATATQPAAPRETPVPATNWATPRPSAPRGAEAGAAPGR